MPRMIGALSLFVAVALLILTLPLGAKGLALPAPATQPPATSARAMALYEPESGTFLAEKNADERLPMASTTKIMTALVALETLPLDSCNFQEEMLIFDLLFYIHNIVSSPFLFLSSQCILQFHNFEMTIDLHKNKNTK